MKSFLISFFLLMLMPAGQLLCNTDVDYLYEALANGTVRFTVHNNTDAGFYADIIREAVVYPQNGEVITEFHVPSGSTYVYIDDAVTPGKSYQYIFEYRQDGNDWVINTDIVTAISTIPALGSFNLIAPSYNDEYDVLHDGSSIWLDNTNIRADASDDGITGSVVFYLNGKKSIDNAYPFALFGDVKGDYKKGRLKNGSYSLIAIAYPKKNGKGIPGDTASVNFTVQILYPDEKVTAYPNPVQNNAMIQINGKSDSSVAVEILDQSGADKRTIYQGKLDQSGVYEYNLSASDFKKGVYILSVHINGKIIQKRLIIQ